MDVLAGASVTMLRDSGATAAPVKSPTRAAPRMRPAVVLAGGAALLLSVLAGIAVSRIAAGGRAPADASRSLALSLELPPGVVLAPGYSPPFALSPSGSHAVVVAAEAGSTRLFVRALDGVALRALPGTEDARQPCISPDGRSVAYFADRKLKRIPLDGGTALPLWDFGSNSRGAAWPREGTLVVSASQTSGLLSVPDGGGKPTPLTALDAARGERSHRWPEAVPGGPWVLFTVGFEGASYDEGRIDAVSLDTGERKTVLSQAAFGRVLPGGRLLFVRGGRVHAVKLDPVTLKTSGVPEAVLAGVRYDPQNGAAHLAVSASGAVVYGPAAPVSPETYLSFLDRAGNLTRLSDKARLFRDPRLSPDGRSVAVVVGTSTESDLFVVDERGTISQLTFRLSPHRPVFHPTDGSIAVGAESKGVWRLLSVAPEGKGPPRVLYEGSRRVYPNAWSPDGRSLVFQEDRAETGWDLLVLDVDVAGAPGGPPRPLADTPFHETNAMLSPDGGWIAYESDELDALVQAHVRAFPGGGGKVRASAAGARWPTWARDGSLYFWDTSAHRLSFAKRSGPTFGENAPVFPAEGPFTPALAPITISVTGARFDVVGNGERFLVLEKSVPPHEPVLTRPVLLLGWDPLRR
ncbi:MAG: PD40 domain-containing protein [Acidobacteria bacterium]|nr:PD40 domain-containing protein [Acidobacteriota bacterium]